MSSPLRRAIICKLTVTAKLFYSAKVVCAYLETTDPKVLKLAKKELQPLLKEGVLKLPEHNQPKKSG